MRYIPDKMGASDASFPHLHSNQPLPLSPLSPLSEFTPPPPQMARPSQIINRHRRVLPDLYEDAQDILPHESLEKYTAGGFHPVNLGDTFRDGRYTIRHKLGFGGFATVWLAHDQETPQWVSIKVKSAAVSTKDLDQDQEITILKQLDKCYTESAQRQSMPFVRLVDCFHHTGPNGTHNCLVTELLGPPLSSILECYDWRGQTIQPDTMLRASCQLLDAIAFLHQAGFAHGDVSNANVAFTYKITNEEDLFDATGDPVTADYTSDQIPWSPELPRHLVQYTGWPGWYEGPFEELRLIDLGEAFPIGNTVTSISQPSDLRSPETFFIGSFDYRHDLWRGGCVIYSLYYQKRPFPYLWGKDAHFIIELILKLGPLPDQWQNRWEDLKSQVQGFEKEVSRFQREPIIETFEPRRNAIISNCENGEGDYAYEKDEYSQHDYAALASLFWVIKGLLQHQPDKRLSLQEAAAHIRSKWTDHRRESELKKQTIEELV
ncbi:kinase-like protein [Xylaria sp. FL1777]|nr:kinase-like protein [Xylaria sp. FL1777]